MFSEIIPNLIDYSKHLDMTIQELQAEILQMEQITNKVNVHKKPQELKYLQNKSVQNLSPPKLNDLTTDIDRILTTADQFLQEPNKSVIESKKIEPEDYVPPKRVKATLEPYKQGLPPKNKKMSPLKKVPKVHNRRSGSLIKPDVTPKIGYLKRESTKSFKGRDVSKLSPNKIANSISTDSPIKVEDHRKQLPQQHSQKQLIKQSSQPYLQPMKIPPIVQQPAQVQQQPIQQQASQPIQPIALLKKAEFTGLKELGRLKKMKDAIYHEYVQSYNYFREKEQKARCRFLTKYHQHMNERKKLIQAEVQDDKQTFYLLKNEIDHELLEHIETMRARQSTSLLVVKYSELLQQNIESVEFDENLLHTLRKMNPQSISRLQMPDLLEIFRLWSKIQILRQNFQQLMQAQEPIPALSKTLAQWLCLQVKTKKRQILVPKISLKVLKHQQCNSQLECLTLNKLVVNCEIIRFLQNVISQIQFNKSNIEQSMILFKMILNTVAKRSSFVFVFRQADIDLFKL